MAPHDDPGSTGLTFYSTQDLAVLLDVPVSTIEHWRSSPGAGPRFAKIGRHVRYSADAVRVWIQENEHDETQ
jgi:hypothetical protein